MSRIVSADEARELLSGATPGPWRWLPSRSDHDLMGGEDGSIFVHSDGSALGEYNPTIEVTGPDAALIAAAPDLVATVVRLYDILAAERGDRAPEGWTWDATYGIWRHEGGCCYVSRPSHTGWYWHADTAGSGTAPTALEAIEAADRAAKEQARPFVITHVALVANPPDPNCVLNAPVEERIGLDQNLVKPTPIPGSVEVRLLGTPFALPSFVRQMAARIVHPDGTMPKDRSPGATCESIVSVWDNEVRVEGAQSSTATAIYNAITEHRARHREPDRL